MFKKKVELNQEIADEVVNDYLNTEMTKEEIAEKYNMPTIYIAVILRSRNIGNKNYKKKTMKIYDDDQKYGAILREKDNDFLKLILENTDAKIFNTQREKDVVLARLGIGYEKAMTYEEVGDLQGVGKERIRQIYNRAYHNAKLNVLRYRANNAALKKFAAEKEEREYAEKNKNWLELPIEELELSVRAFNALYRCGVRYIEELTYMTKQQISEIRYIGKHTVEEIENKLAEKNLCLR